MVPLVAFPNMGVVRGDLQEGLRALIFRDYVIFYIDEPERLLIVRVLHGSRDMPAVFA